MDKTQSFNLNNLAASPKVEINPVRALVRGNDFGLVILIFGHPLLALAMRSSSLIATAHAFLTLVLGVWLAIFSKDTRKVMFAAAYITGAEVLWRMTHAGILWESGKYFTVLILVIALLRMRHWKRMGLPLVFFLLLCISLPLTILAESSARAFDDISFYMSGPLALAVCAIYFSQITIDGQIMRRLAWYVIVPVLGIATLTASSTLASSHISFTDESNFVTSGGFGPNQVSAILGLGGALALMLFIMGRRMAGRWAILILALGLLTLIALTFSRGGLYNAAVMFILAMAHYMRNSRARIAMLIGLLAVGMAGGYLIFPRLNAFTGGMLEQRFADTDPTLRLQIARAEFNLWLANPLLGVGLGQAEGSRAELLGFRIAAHTEYTRILAEHGTAGLLAMLILLLMAIQRYMRGSSIEEQTWIAALLAWPMMEMTHAAMRIVAISFLFGLAMVNWAPTEEMVDAPTVVKR
jgi:O-antigen ligase